MESGEVCCKSGCTNTLSGSPTQTTRQKCEEMGKEEGMIGKDADIFNTDNCDSENMMCKPKPSGGSLLDKEPIPDSDQYCCVYGCIQQPISRPGETGCTGDFIEGKDDYCEDGKWTSRTKFVALQLIAMAETVAENDYVIFCDSAVNALNVNPPSGTNNFCVLTYGDNKVVFGTSLNSDIGSNEFSELIGATNCNVADDGQYHVCDGNKAWYNEKIQSIIYSNEEIPVERINFLEKSLTFLKTPFKTLFGKIPSLESFVDKLTKFDKLYLSVKGTKEIKGVIESITIGGTPTNNLVIEYKNLGISICDDFIDEYDINKEDVDIRCDSSSNNYYVTAEVSGLSSSDLDEMWKDLTAKLRPSS